MNVLKKCLGVVSVSLALLAVSCQSPMALEAPADGTSGTSGTETTDSGMAELLAQISSINAAIDQLKSMDKTLDAAIQALQSEDASIKAQLQAQKEALQAQITNLQSYVDQVVAAQKQWATSTFATKDEMNSLSATVAQLQQAIAGLNPGTPQDGEDPLADVSAALQALSRAVDGITARLEALEALAEEIVGMIQSVTVIPVFSDGSVPVSAVENTEIAFEIRPVTAAQKLNGVPASAFSLGAVYTETLTKGAGELVPLTVKAFSAEDGVLTLAVLGDQLAPDFHANKLSASARLYIESGKNAIASAYFPLTSVDADEPEPPVQELVAVDLGLSVKWASQNLGASAPEAFGDYFAWGEIQPKETYVDENYRFFASGGENGGVTKYCGGYWAPNEWAGSGNPDWKLTLEPEDDAAAVLLGENWRMPTEVECRELARCQWTWTEKNGVSGVTVTAPNGNSIFLPAASGMTSVILTEEGFPLGYWSSSLSDPYFAINMVYSQSDEAAWTYGCRRSVGFPIRPVWDSRPAVTSVALDVTELELAPGDTYMLSATVSPRGANETIWWMVVNADLSPGYNTAVSIDGVGKITAQRAGKAIVRAHTANNLYATCHVVVKEPEQEEGDSNLEDPTEGEQWGW